MPLKIVGVIGADGSQPEKGLHPPPILSPGLMGRSQKSPLVEGRSGGQWMFSPLPLGSGAAWDPVPVGHPFPMSKGRPMETRRIPAC